MGKLTEEELLEHRRRMAAANFHSPEAQRKKAESQRGRPRPPEVRAKISAAKLGVLKSEETKQRMRDAAQARKLRRQQERERTDND